MTHPLQSARPGTIAFASVFALAALALAGCNQQTAQPSQEQVPAASIAAPSASPSAKPSPTAANLPAPLVPEAEKGEQGARNVLLGFARALENKQFGVAWALLGPAARGDLTEAQFAGRWADLSDISVAILDGEVEGAAGSLFYTSPTTITATDAGGRPLRYEGPIVLRRVNDVPGATVAQLRWHIVQLDLAWIH